MILSLLKLLFPLLVTVAMAANNFDHCSQGQVIRKEFNTLNDAELEIFFSTIEKSMEVPHPDDKSETLWFGTAKMHFELSKQVHGNPNFLYWHRIFLLDMELKLKELNKDFQFPYFDSGANYQNWQNSKAVTLTGDRFKLNRSVQQGKPTHGELIWNEALFRSTNEASTKGFYEWSKDAEQYHGVIHVLTGGNLLFN